MKSKLLLISLFVYLLLLHKISIAEPPSPLVTERHFTRSHSEKLLINAPETTDVTGRVLKGFLFTLATFFLGVALYRKFYRNTRGPIEGIEILARRQISNKAALLLVKLEGRKFFLATSGDDVKVLSTFGDESSFEHSLSALLEDEKSISVGNG